MCEIYEVSRSGYYEWKERPLSPQQKENNEILKLMKESYKENQGMCGLDKMLEDVRETFPSCGRNRVYRLQKEHRLYARRKKKRKVLTTDSKHSLPVAENLLNQDFETSAKNQVWVTDITQFVSKEGNLYLAIVKDLYTKEVVGWALEKHMRTSLCLSALEKAFNKHRPSKGLIHHSDRGSQYCSSEYQQKLHSYGMKPSMSRKGNCWDNAPAESFFSALKTERVGLQSYKNLKEAKQDLYWYIDQFYNRKRRHQALGNLRIPDFIASQQLMVA